MREALNLNSKRTRKASQRYDANERLSTDFINTEIDEPRTLQEAMDSNQSNQWKEALQPE